MSVLDPRSRTKRLHFIGIGGIGMSGIAEVLLNQGHSVSGSDRAESDSTRRLAGLGARISLGHAAKNVGDADVVVVSSAVGPDNPEVIEARRLRTPIIQRAEMLAELMRGKLGLAIAGSHGKTTTTSMLAQVLTHAGLDPTLVIGGKVDSLGGGNAKLGGSDWVVAEADESDGSFLHLPATYCVVTNIDNDHLDHYASQSAILDTFVEFVNRIPYYGVAVVCESDAGVRAVLPRLGKPVVTYGLPGSDYCATQLERAGLGNRITIAYRGQPWGVVQIAVPGEHNVLNALACVALASQLGLSRETIAAGLAHFQGVKRRFEIKLQDPASQTWIVDDYGHHPTEVRATLAAARAVWKGRIVTVFQPHRYTRTQHCREDFWQCFTGTDVLLLSDHYAAGEEPIAGVNSEALAREISAHSTKEQTILFTGDLAQTRRELMGLVQPGDLILCMGAGTITRFADQLARAFLPGFQGDLLEAEPLARHTYYRIGGPADWLAIPRTLGDLQILARWAHGLGLKPFFLGNGSNLLVSDAGYRGVVIKLTRLNTEMTELKRDGKSVTVRTGSGVAISSFLKRAGESGWGGAEIWTGIPGSIGGAVKMNAGTHLGETASICSRVEAWNWETGELREWQGSELKFGYRHNAFLGPQWIVTSADWVFESVPPEALKARIAETLARRKASQPIDYPSCGSVFKNPPGRHAWEVIDQLGLRGTQQGGAQISEKHPNFIVNLGGATASDVRTLIERAQLQAKSEQGIQLETEVVMLGF